MIAAPSTGDITSALGVARGLAPKLPKPIVKWAGGKRRLLPELLARMPRQFTRYVEPFVGGGALFFAIEGGFSPHARGARALLCDANTSLIECYDAIRRDPRAVYHIAQYRAEHHSPEFYAQSRALFNGLTSTLIEQAALFVYLNRACFNGLYRVNKAGEFNVPIGRYKTIKIPPVERFVAVADALRDVDLRSWDFRGALDTVRPGDFVYCDPPYLPISETSEFTAYAALGFDDGDHVALEAQARELAGRGIPIMLSNSDTERARDIYKDPIWTITRVESPRHINAQGAGRGMVGELIITGGY